MLDSEQSILAGGSHPSIFDDEKDGESVLNPLGVDQLEKGEDDTEGDESLDAEDETEREEDEQADADEDSRSRNPSA